MITSGISLSKSGGHPAGECHPKRVPTHRVVMLLSGLSQPVERCYGGRWTGFVWVRTPITREWRPYNQGVESCLRWGDIQNDAALLKHKRQIKLKRKVGRVRIIGCVRRYVSCERNRETESIITTYAWGGHGISIQNIAISTSNA